MARDPRDMAPWERHAQMLRRADSKRRPLQVKIGIW
jgi:hypothetical protein